MADAANTLTALVPTVFAAMLRVLRQTGFVLNGVNRSISAQTAGLNQTISIPVSATQAAYTVTPASKVPDLVATTPTTTPLVLDQFRGSRFHVTGEEMARIQQNGPGFRVGQIDQAIATLVHEMAGHVATKLAVGAGYAYGTAGTTPFGSDASAIPQLWKLLSDKLAPEVGRYLTLDTAAYAKLFTLTQFQKANEATPGTEFNRMVAGMLGGFTVGYDQSIATHTKGAAVNYKVAQTGGVAAGATTFVVGGTGSTGNFVAGDVIQIGTGGPLAVVKAWDSVGKVITLNAGLLSAVANAKAVTVQNNSVRNIACHMDALYLAARAPEQPVGGDVASDSVVISDPVTGLALRLAEYKGYHATQFELSTLYGSAVVRPDQAVVLLG
jgi:hypothetical protein